MKLFNKQQGIALLEVLIAFVIVMVSIAALYQLHNKYLRNEIKSSERLTALNIAEGKLNDLRNFGSLSVSAGVPAFDDIGNDTGGVIASGSKSVGTGVYNLTWNSVDNSSTKDVTITVSWNNTADQVQLFGSIARAQSITEERLTSSSTASSDKPVVTYTPGVAPDVVSIELGNGSKQETTKPLPEVSNSGGSIQVQFNTITYNAQSKTQVLADSLTLSCNCQFGSATKETALPAEPTLIDNLLYWVSNDTYVDKKWGESSSNQQSSLCNICCEHHFDRYTDSTGNFTDYFNKLNFPSSKYNSSLAVVTSGDYIDSCRLLRLDGYYKPMPDWNLVKLVIMNSDFLKNEANQTSYQKYIKYVVKSYVELQQAGSWSGHNSTLISDYTSANILSFSQWLAISGNAAAGGDTTTDVVIDKNSGVAVNKQFIARGIYVDLMADQWVDGLSTSASDYLAKVPFYDINMTLLTQWSSSNTNVATVYSDPIKTLTDADSDYYGVYKRGYIIDDKTGTTVITATAYQGNSSIAAYQKNNQDPEMAVTDYDNSKALTDTVSLTVGGTVTPGVVVVSGSLYCLDQTSTTTGTGQNKETTYSAIACDTNGNNKTFDVLTLSSSDSSVATCTLSAVNTTASPAYRPFSCTTTQGASFSISVGGTKTGYTIYPFPKNIQLDPASTATSVQVGCINVYQTTLDTNPGMNFDSQGCVTH